MSKELKKLINIKFINLKSCFKRIHSLGNGKIMPVYVSKSYSSSIFYSLILILVLFINALTIHKVYSKDKENVIATAARIGGDVFRTRLIIDLSKKVNFRTFTLADPYRLVVDLANVKFNLPKGAGNQKKGVITAFRYGFIAEGKSRIVIDLNQPAKVEKAFSLEPQKDQSAKLVIDFIPIDRETFLETQLLEREKRLAEKAKKVKRKSLFSLTPDDPIISGKPKGNSVPIVVIDPGHGGIDPGAIGVGGSKEKNIVLQFSKNLREELASDKKFKVFMTRRSDVFIPLKGRVRYARRKNADLFVSIHADSIKRKDPTVRGATVYTLSEKASDAQAQAAANSENSSDVLAGVDTLPEIEDATKIILLDLIKRETKNHSVAFANILMEAMRRSTIVKKHPIKYANFVVLKAPDVPSVLVELGYLSSKNDEKLLKSAAWQKKVAKSVANAIETYFKKKLTPNPF